MAYIGHTVEVFDDAIAVGLLDNKTGHATLVEQLGQRGKIGDTIDLRNAHDLYALEMGIGIYHGSYLGVDGFGQQDAVGLLANGNGHHGSLGRGRSAIVHRGIRHLHACKPRHEGLVFKDIVECALRYLSLVRRVTGKELRTRYNLRNHGRHVMVIHTGTGKAYLWRIGGAQRVEIAPNLNLAHGLGHAVVALEAHVGRHVGIKVVERLQPNDIQHLLYVIRRMGEVFEHGVFLSALYNKRWWNDRLHQKMAEQGLQQGMRRHAMTAHQHRPLQRSLVGSLIHQGVEL